MAQLPLVILTDEQLERVLKTVQEGFNVLAERQTEIESKLDLILSIQTGEPPITPHVQAVKGRKAAAGALKSLTTRPPASPRRRA